jgi:hypothetical protein
MRIKFSPSLSNRDLAVSVAGDCLTINGQVFDFTQLLDGATLPLSAINSEHFSGPVERINGELHLTLRLPHGANPPRHVAFPEPITVTEDGPIALPFAAEATE